MLPITLSRRDGAWPLTRVSRTLGLRHPIIQGPFGNGLSSVPLAAAVSNGGGLGSFGVHHLAPDGIADVAAQLRRATAGPFALNLWVSTHDEPETAMTRERYAAAAARLAPVYERFAVQAPPYPETGFSATFPEQVEAVIAARPAAFSFVFGVPDAAVLEACREQGIVTIGTAITPDEAVALDETGVDLIVVSGTEAGGHRVAFLAPAEESLVGTTALVAIAAHEVEAPVIAAGGIADARGIVAAFALGAEGVQIGTAFLATEESNATPQHKELLFTAASRHTRLTRAFTGRLARGIPNEAMDALTEAGSPVAGFPYNGYLLGPILAAARASGSTDGLALWAGQAASLVEHRHAADLLTALVQGTDRLLGHAVPQVTS